MSKDRGHDRLPERSNGTQNGKLSVPKELMDPGFHYRYVNDTDYRLGEMLDIGYNFIPVSEVKRLSATSHRSIIGASERDGNYICKIVNRDGGKAYLMRIEQDLFDKRQQEKIRITKEIEEAKLSQNQEGTYAKLEQTSARLNDN